jgi:hypothetical protein
MNQPLECEHLLLSWKQRISLSTYCRVRRSSDKPPKSNRYELFLYRDGRVVAYFDQSKPQVAAPL